MKDCDGGLDAGGECGMEGYGGKMERMKRLRLGAWGATILIVRVKNQLSPGTHNNE